ncbi:MAG: hypothetical protein LIP09_05935 [Bacteroidales bacterium]|nr:hypothetical protein [Bacteroidales bacterium]
MQAFLYKDDTDKSFGLTGMVISLNVWDQSEMLQEVNLDNGEGYSITFTPDFYFNGNPRYSAKLAWKEMVAQYKTLLALVLGNIVCRSMAQHHHYLSDDSRKEVYELVADEGRESCSLEKDEIDSLFDNTLQYLENIYSKSQMTDFARRFAKELEQRRRMTASDVNDLIQYLRTH